MFGNEDNGSEERFGYGLGTAICAFVTAVLIVFAGIATGSVCYTFMRDGTATEVVTVIILVIFWLVALASGYQTVRLYLMATAVPEADEKTAQAPQIPASPPVAEYAPSSC